MDLSTDPTLVGPVDLLLSHRSTDTDAAVSLAEGLEREVLLDGRSVKVFLDVFDITPGQGVVGRINWGLANSRYVGLLMTPDYFASPSGWTDAEWHAALYDDPSGRRGRLLPLLLRDTPDLPPLLRHLNIIDLRDRAFERGYGQLVAVLRGESPRAQRTKGQITNADGRLSPGTLAAERSSVGGAPDAVTERLLLNLLPVEMPANIWVAPLAKSLARGNGREPEFPKKGELREIIRAHRETNGQKPFSPAFLRDGAEVITFHRLNRKDHPLAPITMKSGARATKPTDWLQDPGKHRLLVNLLNMTVERHARQQGLLFDRDEDRYLFPTGPGPSAKLYAWRKGAKPRTVAQPLVDGDGNVYRWKHHAARLPIMDVGGHFFLVVRPTLVFTEDGTVDSIIRGPGIGSTATKYLGRERNQHLLYHLHFWAHVLGTGKTPIRIRAGDQMLIVDPQPLAVDTFGGIEHDRYDLESQLQAAEELDDEWLDVEGQADEDYWAAG